jgi:hypothetical protein
MEVDFKRVRAASEALQAINERLDLGEVTHEQAHVERQAVYATVNARELVHVTAQVTAANSLIDASARRFFILPGDTLEQGRARRARRARAEAARLAAEDAEVADDVAESRERAREEDVAALAAVGGGL